MTTKYFTFAVLLLTAFLLPGPGSSHEGSFKEAGSIPPFGPHGGRTVKLTRHIAEISVKAAEIEVYILERDAKTVAADASGVSLTAAVPGKSPSAVPLTRKNDGYAGNFTAPGTARRIVFTIQCVLDGKKEKGTYQYEPRK